MSINNSINTLNLPISILSGTGTINIGTDATNKNINIGSSSITNALSFVTDTGTIAIGASASAIVNIGNDSNSSDLFIDTGTGAINLGTTGPKTITIGNTTGATSVVINSGTGAINIGTAIAKTISIGNTDSSTQVLLDGTNINIGTSVATTVSVGNAISGTTVNLLAGTGGVFFTPVNATGATTTISRYGVYYIMNRATLSTINISATISVGSKIIIVGQGAGGWKITQNSGQTIHSTATSTTTGTGGSLSSGGRYDCVELTCTVANTDLVITKSIGTLVFV